MEMMINVRDIMQKMLCMCVLLAGFGLATQAQANRLVASSVTISQGGKATLPIEFSNETEISGGQFTVTLPQGIIVDEVLLDEARSDGHTLEYRANASGNSFLILFYAQPTTPLKGNGGTLCTLSLSAPSNAATGSFPVTIGDVRLAKNATDLAEVQAEGGLLTVTPRYEVTVGSGKGGTTSGGGTFDADATVTLTATPDEGYHFVQWSDGSTENPYTFKASAHVELMAEFAPNIYSLTYTVDGAEYKKVKFEYGASVTVETEPTKEGHTFSGWSEVPATMPAKDVTVTGTFTANSYTLTFLLDDKTFKTETVVYGTAITAPEAPTKEGHTFSGWSEIPATMPAKDVTVTGSFTTNSYKVTYILDGETFKTAMVTYGTAIPSPEVPAKEGYNFSGWGEMPATMPAQELTFNGSYTINKDMKYNLVYMVDGVEYKREVISFGDPISLITEPTKEGHTFSGWSEAPETMPLHDVTVTGTFTANSYTLTYILEGETYKTETVVFGTAITAPEVPTKEGHTFSGWSEVPETMPAQDVTVTGSYTINSYTLLYMVDGAEYKKVVLEYGTGIVAEAEPTKEGHTFNGWSEVPETMPAQDVTVEGSFTVNRYKVTYVVDGEEYATDSIAYGEAVILKEDPVKEGYTFSGWSEVPETMPAQDVTVEGSFTVDGINTVFTGNRLVDVYTLQGTLIKRQIAFENFERELPTGIYIINGKKVFVR